MSRDVQTIGWSSTPIADCELWHFSSVSDAADAISAVGPYILTGSGCGRSYRNVADNHERQVAVITPLNVIEELKPARLTSLQNWRLHAQSG